MTRVPDQPELHKTLHPSALKTGLTSGQVVHTCNPDTQVRTARSPSKFKVSLIYKMPEQTRQPVIWLNNQYTSQETYQLVTRYGFLKLAVICSPYFNELISS